MYLQTKEATIIFFVCEILTIKESRHLGNELNVVATYLITTLSCGICFELLIEIPNRET
jgi:hypothetical protein